MTIITAKTLKQLVEAKILEALAEKAPKGWEKTVKGMKKHKDITNPFALANYMKNKGFKSHKQDEGAAIVGEANALYEKHIGFKNLVKQLTDKGHSEDSAKAIAYHIGVAKYGKKKMTQAAASHKPLSDKDAKNESMINQEPWDAKRVLKVMVHVLKKNPELAAMSPDEVAMQFVENIPEITDSEVVTPGELEKLAAMALKMVGQSG
jgi:hypothetical protein